VPTREQLEEMVKSVATAAAVPAAYGVAAMIIEKYADTIEAAPVVGGSLESRQGAQSALRKVAAEARVMAQELRKMTKS
jgi:hypothetical protein